MFLTLLSSPRVLMLVAGVGCLLALGSWGFVMRTQRNVARLERDRAVLELGQERLVLQGMRLAQTAKLQEAREQAQAIGQRTNAVIQQLDASLPKTDEEARQWALNAIHGVKP